MQEDKSTENNYRETKERSNCLWCRKSTTNKRKVFCDVMKKDVLPNYTCDLWRYRY